MSETTIYLFLFSLVLSASVGLSIKSFITKKRFQEAKRCLLRQGDLDAHSYLDYSAFKVGKIVIRNGAGDAHTLSSNQREDCCPKCGQMMILKNGAYGEFLGCSNYPICDGSKNIDN